MRTDRDQRTDKEIEIDEFLSQFDTPIDDLNTDINSYLDDLDSTKKVAADTFYNKPSSGRSRSSASNRSSSPAASADGGSSSNGSGKNASRNNKPKSGKPSRAEKKAARKARIASLKGKDLKVKLRALIEDLFLVENPNYDPSKGSTIVVNGKKKKNKPMKFSFKKLIRDFVVLGCTAVLLFFLYAFVVVSTAPKIDAADIYATVEQSSRILDDSGKAVDTIYYTQDRELVKYKDCPEDLVNAFVAIEDKTFWKHNGFNWTRMIGAVIQSFVGGGNISGTSTITQQLARNVFLSETKSVRSIKRKVLEMYYASQIEHCLTKEEIIEAYMNTIYLGYGCYGVQAAAQAYFSTDVKNLTLVQCAALASLPPAPDAYALIKIADSSTLSDNTANIITRSPETYIANDITKDRRSTVLSLMNEQGYITDEEYKANENLDLIKFIKPTINTGGNTYSYFHEYLVDTVIEDLMKKYELDYEDAEKMVYTQGLKIYSTIDSQAQETVVKEFNDPNNFPGVAYFPTDSQGNAISSGGAIKMYKLDTYFNSDESFTVKSDECTINDDGSVTIKRGKRLNIYETTYDGVTDYSLEFKQMYTKDDGTLYSIAGGFINIPAEFKSLDKNDDLVISKEYFDTNKGLIKISGDTVIITKDAYSLQQKVIQPQAAMVITDVKTGQVKAMVGGRSTKGQRLFNRCLTNRQPGSSIKPLAVYGAALQKSYELEKEGQTYSYTNFGYDRQGTKGYGSYITTQSAVVDEVMVVNGRQWPKNAGGGYTGTQTFRSAIQQSINTCAVKIQLQVGTDFSIDMLKKFGITSLVTSKDDKSVNDENAAALALGGLTKGVSPLEMAEAYTAFPNGGVRHDATCYTKVVDRNGKTILKAKAEKHKVMDEGVAWIMTDVLKSVVNRGLGTPAALSSVQAGGKTGTTNDEYDIWFDGFTPTYAAALWVGVDCNLSLTSMSSATAALWGKIMRQVKAANTGTYLTMPSNVVQVGGEYFTKGTEKGRSTYVADEKKKKEEEERKKKEEEEKKRIEAAQKELVARVDKYLAEHPEATLEEACLACATTVDAYKAAGGTMTGVVIPEGEQSLIF